MKALKIKLENTFSISIKPTPPTQLTSRFPLIGGGLRVSGFTLVELIVVIVILAILATIAFLSFNSYSSSARDSTRLADINSLNKGIELYQVNAGYYPSPEGTISTGTVNTVEVSYKGIIADRISKIVNISKTPTDPLSSSNYVYGISSDRKYFQIGMALENANTSYNSMENGKYKIENIFPLTRGNTRGLFDIEQTYSASGSANYYSRIKGNYLGMIKYSTGTSTKSYYIANVPSLLYNNNGTVDLLSTGTYYVVNNSTNIPYQINPNITTNNKTADIIIQEITNSPTATLTGINITSIITNTGGAQEQTALINSLFSGSILSSFGGNIGVVTSTITNTPEASSSTSVSYSSCTLSGTSVAHSTTVDAYSEYSIPGVAGYDCTNRKQSRTCNNGVLDGDNSYGYDSCVKGVVNNCSASGSYTKNGHTYSIPALNHSSGSTNILSSNVSENNGTFRYTLSNIECNDGLYINSTESATPSVVSCNSGFGINGNICSASQNGSCNNTVALGCSIGSPINDNGATTCGTTRTWNCSGLNGGSNSSQCSFNNGDCRGEQVYTTPGTYTWTVPAGVNSVSVVCVGGGGGSSYSKGGGGGGGLGYKNNISIISGNQYQVIIGSGGVSGTSLNNDAKSGGNSSFNGSICIGYGGTASVSSPGTGGSYIGDGGGNGGNGGSSTAESGGGGGAGGYIGNGGNGGKGTASMGGNGGGVGIFGLGINGLGGIAGTTNVYWSGGFAGSDGLGGGGGGGGGGNAGSGYNGNPGSGGNGITYGGGSGKYYNTNFGGNGACRIIWPGITRQFPSTDVGP